VRAYQTSKVKAGRGNLKQTPQAPASVTATKTDEVTIVISWQDPADQVALTGYNIYRSYNGGSYQYLDTVAPVAYPSSTSYTDETLPVGSYTYRVGCQAATIESTRTTSNTVQIEASAQNEWASNTPSGFSFTLGTPSRVSLAEYRPQSEPYLTMSSLAGFTLDDSADELVYDGTGSVGQFTITVDSAAAVFGWTIPDVPLALNPSVWSTGSSPVSGVGATFNLSQYANHAGATPVYSITSGGGTGISINASTGLLTVGPTATADTYSVTVDLAGVPTTTGDLPTLTVSSATGAWTFGQAFKQGAATYLVQPSGVQVDIRNRWSDGTVKFAVISGVNVGSVAFTATSTPPAAPGTVAYTNPNASVQFTGVINETVNCPSTTTTAAVFGATPSAHTSGLVRTIAGSVMTERHFYVKTSDAHLRVWFYVRSYSNGTTEVEAVVENGWARVASPVEKSYTANITINGTSVFNAAVAHRHHTRWSKRAWIVGGVTTTTEPVTPSHNMAYLRATKLVPNYAVTTVPEAVLAALPQSINPMERGSFDFASSGVGYHALLGLLPAWEAAYVVSGDARGYRAMLVNEQASNCCNMSGGAGSCTRDETTGNPIRHVDISADSYGNGYSPNYGAGKVYLGSNTSANVWTTDPAHSWAAGYLAYLITGRRFSLETAQFISATEMLGWGLAVGNGGLSDRQRWMNGEDRHCGWSMRQMACSFAISPDGDSWRTGMVTHLTEAVSRWHTNEVGFNNLGIRLNIYNNTDYSVAPYNSCGAFQQWFLAQSFAFGYDIAADSLDATTKANWLAAAQFHLSMPVGMLGTRPGGYCYRRAPLPPNQNFPIGPSRTKPLSAASFYSNWGTVYDTMVSLGTIPAETCSANDTLQGFGFTITADAYTGNLHPAIAYAVDFGVSGASTAYGRLTGASNYSTLTASMGSYPQFAVVPR
jgi:hypothetical protein